VADLTQDVNGEIREERVAQAAGQPAQALDSTTLFVKRLQAIRNTAAGTNLQDSNQALDQVLPD
jgi:hypothetical protein